MFIKQKTVNLTPKINKSKYLKLLNNSLDEYLTPLTLAIW